VIVAGTWLRQTSITSGQRVWTGQPGGGFDFGDLAGGGFENIFDLFGRGSGGGRARTRSQRGEDIVHPVEITLEEAYSGATRTLQLDTDEVCATCEGTGVVNKSPCPTCQGAGIVPRVKRLEVKIPAGVKDGERVRIAGQGGAGTGGAPRGDLFLNVSLRPNDRFERKGDDLYEDVNVPLTTAVLGGEVEVPTIRGSNVLLKIPPETQNGATLRLTGLGMPRTGSAARGDMYARVKVQLPTNLTPRQRELFEQLKAEPGR
jgi:molecular chaperone DnaJ